MPLRMFSKKTEAPKEPKPLVRHKPTEEEYVPAGHAQKINDPLEQALVHGRYGLVLNHPDLWTQANNYPAAVARASQAVDEAFGLVPEGFASIPLNIADHDEVIEEDVETKPYLLARFAVTNLEYQHFVDNGGYQDLALWPEDIWPHLIDFVDKSGETGPRFWQGGRHNTLLQHHPVVGLSWYEASAYAKWAGYRLPTEEEWQMAATWCIRSAAHTIRRYPWGDAFDLHHCNIWASGHRKTLAVDACTTGSAPNGVLQLIGNVWEWTDSEFKCADGEGRTLVGDALLKSIRGGAFDTYFPWQATSSFRTGLTSLLRAHNVGFRCAMDLPS